MSERVFFGFEDQFIHRDAIGRVVFTGNAATIYILHTAGEAPPIGIIGDEARRLREYLSRSAEDFTADSTVSLAVIE